jgi:ERCC4-related helicase
MIIFSFVSETASQARAKPFVIGHPKMEKLQEIVLDHFNTHSDGKIVILLLLCIKNTFLAQL